MAVDTRHKDGNWSVYEKATGRTHGRYDHAILAVLMDIRDRLDALRCPNFIAIPHMLRAIQRNTAKPKRKAVPKKGKR